MGSIFNDQNGQQGLIKSFWPISITSVTLRPGFEYIFTMKKIVTKKLNLKENCMQEKFVKLQNYNHMKCIQKFTTSMLLRSLKKIGSKLCWIPQADFLIKLMNISDVVVCKTTQEMKNMNEGLEYSMSMSTDFATECKEPCNSGHIAIKLFSDIIKIF